MKVYTLSEWNKQKKKRDEKVNESGGLKVYSYDEWAKEKGIQPITSINEKKAEDIAPVRESTSGSSMASNPEGQKDSYLQKGALSGGVSLKNISTSLKATEADMEEDATKGILGLGERIWDGFVTLAPYVAQADYYRNGGGYNVEADKIFNDAIEKSKQSAATYVAKDLIDEEKIAKRIVTEPFEKKTGINMEASSFIGSKGDSLVQSASDMLARQGLNYIVPGAGLALTGLSSFGGETENAFNQGAKYEDAVLSGFISASAEVGTEKIAGIKFGGKTLTDGVAKNIAKRASKEFLGTLAKWGFNTVGEGAEEVLSGYATAIGQKLTYMNDKEISELFSKEDAKEEFFAGAILGGMFEAGSVAASGLKGIDYVTELDKNEKQVIDAVYNEMLAEKETEGKKLTQSEKSKLYDSVEKALEKGYIDIETIERTLGGDTYKAYKNASDSEDALKKEYEELGNTSNPTLAQTARYNELSQKIKDLETTSNKGQLKDQMSKEVFEKVKNTRLIESYNEQMRKNQAFEADLESYTNESAKQTVKNFMEQTKSNNSNRAHDFVDMLTKVSEDRGHVFEFMTTAQLEESIKNGNQYDIDVDPKKIEAFIHKKSNRIVINMDANKSLRSLVGHEVSHTFEKANGYDKMQEVLFKYAEMKGEYADRLASVERRYGKDDVNYELTADLLGDYIMGDTDFINSLSTENPGILKRIYNEIKYLYKMATAGSAEARQFEKVKREIERAWRESASPAGAMKVNRLLSDAEVNEILEKNGVPAVHRQGGDVGLDSFGFKEDGTIKYSLADSDGNQLTKEQQDFFKDSKVRDEKGNLKVMYHGTERGAGFTVFDNEFSDDGRSFFFTDSNVVAKGYSGTYSTYAPKAFSSVDEVNEEIHKGVYNSEYHVEEENGEYVLYYEDDEMETSDSLDEIYRVFEEGYGRGMNSANYKVYLNLKNPLIVDAEGRNWDELPLTKKTGIDRYNYIYVNGGTDGTYNVEWEDMLNKYGDAESAEMSLDGIRSKFGVYVADDVAKGRQDFESINVDNRTKELIPRTTRQFSYYAKKNGYDGVIFKNIYDNAIYASGSEKFEKSTVAIAFDSNQIKSVANQKPTKDADIRYSLSEDNKGNKLSEGQKEYFKDSKIVDPKGYLKVMYHGTPNEFTVFNPMLQGGKNGTAEGYGIYFTDSEEVTKSYGDKRMSGYLNVTHPARADRKTIKKGELVKLLKATTEVEAKQYVDDGDYDNVKDALRDTWISNYVDTYSSTINEAYRECADSIISMNDSDMSIIQEVMGGMAIRDYESAYKFYDILKSTIGIDGFITEWNSDLLPENKAQIVVAFDSNQFKDLGNQNPTDNPDINLRLADDAQYNSKSNEAFPIYAKDLRLQGETQTETEIAPTTQIVDDYGPLTESDAIVRDDEQIENHYFLDDIAPEVEEQYNGEFADHVKPVDPFYEKDIWEVGKDRSQKAYMYENPEVKPFFQEEARYMLGELDNSQKGERFYNDQLYYDTNGEMGYFGTKRHTSEDIAYLLDTFNYTYKDIAKGLNAIVEDNGKENNAISKRIEFLIDERLRLGYTDFWFGDKIPPNQEYINLLNEKQVTEYSDESWNEWLRNLSEDDIKQYFSASEREAEIAPITQMVDETTNEAEEFPIKTTADKLNEKQKNLQTELDNVKALREQARQQKQDKINSLQATYDALKNKDTKKANALKLRIEKQKRIASDIDSTYEKRIDTITKRQERIAKEQQKDHANKDRLERAYAKIDRELAYNISKLEENFDARRKEIASELESESAFISNKASEIYDEITHIRKGVRASEELGYLLDMGFGWEDIKKSLLRVSHSPTKVVTKDSACESVCREVIEGMYMDRQADLESMDAKFENELAKLKEAAESAKDEARVATQRKTLHSNIIEGFKNVFASKSYNFDDVLKNAKDLSTFATVDNTPQRVMEKAFGYKEGQILSDLTVNKVAQNETEGIKWLNSITDRKGGLLAQLSKQYNIKPGSKENAAAQMYAEGFYVNDTNEIIKYGDAELAKDFPNPKVQADIKGLANDPRIRKFYDDTLAQINESRTRNGYPEIPRLDNYFLHFRAMEDTFSKFGLPFNPNDIRAKDLPTDLNGVTADLKPGQPYFASAMHRTGKRTSFDLLGGLERYATSAKNQIYHIDDIQNLRALRNYIADTYGQANGLENLDGLSEEEVQNRIEQVYSSHLSTFAKFLNEEANILAGKTALIDRGLEGIIGRRGITFLDTLNRQVGSNMVGYSASSALVNIDALPRAFAKTNKSDFVKGFAQFASNKIGSIFGKDDGFAEQSPVMIRRKGADRFYRTPWQKGADAGYIVMGAVDNAATEIIARTKYNEFIKKGMDAQKAHIETDKWVSRLMGDRSLGQMPQIYNSKTLGLITKFQLEVRNNLDSMFYDTIQDAKVSNEHIQNALTKNAKTAAKITSTLVQLAVGQHLFGKAMESVVGYNPAFDIIGTLLTVFGFDDEEDSEDTVLDNIEQGFLELLEDLPYTSTFTGGRIPIASALPIEELVTGKDEYGNEKSRLKTIGEIAPYYTLPGGYGQLKKTVQGLGMFDDDFPIAGSYTDSGNLRFPVDDTIKNRVQAGLFGQYASENAREYFDRGEAPLKEKQIQELIDLDLPIRDYWDYRKGLKEQNTLEEKFEYVAGQDVSDEQKNIMINNVNGVSNRKEKVDISNYDDFSDYEEFDFYSKHKEKYNFLKDNHISYSEYISDEETKGEYDKIYDWYKKNPNEVTLSKVVTDDVIEYRRMVGALKGIQSDKDENGSSISGSAKEKKIAYINGLELDYGQKIILFRTYYDSKDDKATYNADIVDYLNSREDLSYDEIVTILTELDFTVNPDGTVEW